MTKPDRIQWMDAARGLGIILVVFGHVERGLVAADIAQSSWWQVADYILYTFHMPLFFLLAGLNAPRPLARGRVEYLKNKVWTVGYPYFLWSVIQGLVLVLLASSTNGKHGIDQLFSIPWKPMSQFWFLWVLMACQIVITLVGARAALLIPLAIASFVASQLTLGLTSHFFHALPFFLAGAVLSHRAADLRQVKLNLLLAPAWIIFAGLAYGSLAKVTVDQFESAWALPAGVAGIAAIIWSARMLSGWALAAFAYLGAASMTIYVLHVLASAGLRIVMMKLHLPPIDWLYALACTVFGIVVPLAAHVILGRLGLLWPLGLAPLPKKTPPAVQIAPAVAAPL
jgi:fucose 4-O-acetylase-like acetyltransferase